ncbi:MAG: hypothetical protein A3F18_02195 [Legionellales bacterium RIFCSPHIGHO2_12_FULL_37_14]|nr:MAG: hypothetical protein A3F18_02195 [Legionellales bacterium RIFCSPHIGHO2_12_FULL_37_14]
MLNRLEGIIMFEGIIDKETEAKWRLLIICRLNKKRIDLQNEVNSSTSRPKVETNEAGEIIRITFFPRWALQAQSATAETTEASEDDVNQEALDEIKEIDSCLEFMEKLIIQQVTPEEKAAIKPLLTKFLPARITQDLFTSKYFDHINNDQPGARQTS